VRFGDGELEQDPLVLFRGWFAEAAATPGTQADAAALATASPAASRRSERRGETCTTAGRSRPAAFVVPTRAGESG
jgi:hypothetical protein